MKGIKQSIISVGLSGLSFFHENLRKTIEKLLNIKFHILSEKIFQHFENFAPLLGIEFSETFLGEVFARNCLTAQVPV